MINKSIIQTSIILLSALLVWWFAMPFKSEVVDPLKSELISLQEAKERYSQINLDSLKTKINTLDSIQARVLESYIPKQLRSGRLVYTVAQLAQQNRLNIKGIQYSVVDVPSQNGKKLVIEFQLEGFYENFVAWVRAVELSDILLDIEEIKASKLNNLSDIVVFTVKMSAYGINID